MAAVLARPTFEQSTRHKWWKIGEKAKGAESPLKFVTDRAGILAGIWLDIRGSVAGTLSAPNALGMSSIVREVRLVANIGGEIHRFTGPQYHWMIRDDLEDLKDILPQTTGRVAVTATTFNISMYIPVALNSRDVLGLMLLQNDKTTVTVYVDFEADANVATGATVTATVKAYGEFFTVPPDVEEMQKEGLFSTVLSIIGETQAVAAAGEVTYPYPVGDKLLSLIHGLGFGVSAADGWSSGSFYVATNDQLYQFDPALMDLAYSRYHGRARILGVIPLTLIAFSGLGNYASMRDILHTDVVTTAKTVLVATGAGTLHSVRRTIMPLGGA